MATDRRAFLKGFAVASAAALGNSMAASSVQAQTVPAPVAQASTSAVKPPLSLTVIDRPGSDFMVDVIKSLGIEYVAANPGSSFRSLQESIINYGGSANPEFITCMHEESSAAMAHGYAKAAGKPMGVLPHATVGLQHAAMAIYNAWCDRVPMIIMAGNSLDATKRRAGVEWYHSVQDAAAFLRDFTKWDDTPLSRQHFAESVVRAYKICTTPPLEPVVIVADGDLQETQIESGDVALQVPKLPPVAPPRAIRMRWPKPPGCWWPRRTRSSVRGWQSPPGPAGWIAYTRRYRPGPGRSGTRRRTAACLGAAGAPAAQTRRTVSAPAPALAPCWPPGQWCRGRHSSQSSCTPATRASHLQTALDQPPLDLRPPKDSGHPAPPLVTGWAQSPPPHHSPATD